MDFPKDGTGPAMRALRDDRRRHFAYLMGCGCLNASDAAREAGYSDPGHGATVRVRAHELMQDADVLAAVREVAGNVLAGLGPLAIRQAKAVLDNPKHPSHARMIETVLDRTGHFARTEHKVTVEHTVDTRELEELAKRLAGDLGVDKMKLIGSNTTEGSRSDGQVSGRDDGVLDQGPGGAAKGRD